MSAKPTFYKYRDLNEFWYLLDIIKQQHFIARNYQEFQKLDPKEGTYYISASDKKNIDMMRNGKMQYRLCSFCTTPYSLSMWNEYADGGRGCCFEVVVPNKRWIPYSIRYERAIPNFEELHEDKTLDVLLKKDVRFRGESEVRLVRQSNSKRKIFVKAKIVRVFLGYGLTENEKITIRTLVNRLIDREVELVDLSKDEMEFRDNQRKASQL